jgi:hypothetical protein
MFGPPTGRENKTDYAGEGQQAAAYPTDPDQRSVYPCHRSDGVRPVGWAK